MKNYGMGQHFNPHAIRGKTIKETMLKYCEDKWISEQKGCENMKKNGQREFVIDLLEKMAEKVRNGAYVPEDDVRTIISMQAHWKKGQFRDEQNVGKQGTKLREDKIGGFTFKDIPDSKFPADGFIATRCKKPEERYEDVDIKEQTDKIFKGRKQAKYRERTRRIN